MKLSEKTDRDVGSLRLICPRHQERLYTGEVERAEQAFIKQDMREHLREVREVIESLGEG